MAAAEVPTATSIEYVIHDKKTSPSLVAEAAKLEKKAFPKHMSMCDSLDKEVAKRGSFAAFAYCTSSKQVVGFVLCIKTYVAKVLVAPNYRRLGIAEALLVHAIAHQKKSRQICMTLHVDPERAPAVKLYEKLGFVTQSHLADYYQKDSHAYFMQLDLT